MLRQSPTVREMFRRCSLIGMVASDRPGLLSILDSLLERDQCSEQSRINVSSKAALQVVPPAALNKRVAPDQEANATVAKFTEVLDDTSVSAQSSKRGRRTTVSRLVSSVEVERIPDNELAKALQRSISLLKVTDRSFSLAMRFKAYANLSPPEPAIVNSILQEFWVLHAWRHGCMYERGNGSSDWGKLCMPPAPATATMGLQFATNELYEWQVRTKSLITAAAPIMTLPSSAFIIRPRNAFEDISHALPPSLR